MDLSKLPKLSDTKGAEGEPAPVDVEPVPQTVAYRDRGTLRPGSVGVDVWISTVLGVLFVFLGMTFARFAVAKLAHQPFHTGVEWSEDTPQAGQEVAYFDLQGYTAWGDMGVFLFGLTLLFEAASKAAVVLRPGTASRALLALATLLTLAMVGLNLWACGLMMHVGIAPILSGLAVAFGGWILFDEWQTLKATTPVVRATTARESGA